MLKSVLSTSGKIMLGSAKHHLNDKNSLIMAGAIGLGAGIVTKKASTVVEVGAYAMLGMIAHSSTVILDLVVDELDEDKNEEA